MYLQNGITGFTNSAQRMDKSQFKQLCFNAARASQASLEQFKEPGYPFNFYHAKIKTRTNQFHLLLNEHYPYLAFASAAEYGNIQFIDPPELADAFLPFYRILSKEELNERVIWRKNLLENENELNEAELRELSFWKPERVGDIIFNYWD
ncbi:hypothetical protein [Bacillus sp. SJS]|uniref:hypothetical protein n=1 Tax=Bacillus sp. SJS TaxID=1423321 RepID=UPI0004DD6A49|nr:hypothetical protein [Bacillus sp. SJS]KZZ84438.1 hypothetical protein AS29_011335 [Bacillus sp. SJS]